MRAWTDEVERYSDSTHAEAEVHFKDIGEYPDEVWTIGPRGGIRREKA